MCRLNVLSRSSSEAEISERFAYLGIEEPPPLRSLNALLSERSVNCAGGRSRQIWRAAVDGITARDSEGVLHVQRLQVVVIGVDVTNLPAGCRRFAR